MGINLDNPILQILDGHLERVRLSGFNSRHEQNITCRCPLPNHEDKHPSFALNIVTGAWNCQGCGESGSLKKLLGLLGYSTVRTNALLEPIQDDIVHHRQRAKIRQKNSIRSNPLISPTILPDSILGLFYKKPLDLIRNGFDENLLYRMGIGYDNKKNRIIYPLRDTMGNLIGVSGRSTVGELPRYKVYSGSRYIGTQRIPGDYGPEFDEMFPTYRQIQSRRFLWNAHNIKEDQPIIIVEGFKACLWLLQHGYANTVALMGSDITNNQILILTWLSSGPVKILLDNDEAGRKGSERVKRKLRGRLKTQICQYNNTKIRQPDEMTEKELKETIK